MTSQNVNGDRMTETLPSDQPLMRALLDEATRRGDTLARLAAALGVTYDRLAQWRRGDGSIGNARRRVHERAAAYLGIPTVLVLALAGQIGLPELVWPHRSSLRSRVSTELQRLKRHVYLGAFVPSELDASHDSVRLFVAFLFHELEAGDDSDRNGYRWFSALQSAMAASGSRQPPPRADAPAIF